MIGRGMDAARAWRLGRAAAPVLAGALALGSAAPASAGGWVALGARVGATQLNGNLADYQWDVTPRTSWGAEVEAGRGRYAAALRFEALSTTQDVGGSDSPTVQVSTIELVGRRCLASRWGVSALAGASAGWWHLGYHPDRMSIETAGPGTAIVVDFEPIDTWVAGGGLAFERSLAGPWLASFEVDHRVFELEAAHRNGGAIEVERKRFGDWNARLGLSRVWGRR